MQVAMLDPNTLQAITGDLSGALLEKTRDLLRRYPTSVCAYALFSAWRDISSMFEDEQGIPRTQALEIDKALLDGVRGLLQDGRFQRDELPSEATVENILAGLAILRCGSH